MAAFIVDCSVAMAWLFPDERTPILISLQDRLASESMLVPSHWFLEVTNVLALAEKRARIAQTQVREFIDFVGRIGVEVDAEAADRAFESLLPICRDHGLTSYDAAYLELAVRRSLPLATLDDDLRRAGEKAGVRLLGR